MKNILNVAGIFKMKANEFLLFLPFMYTTLEYCGTPVTNDSNARLTCTWAISNGMTAPSSLLHRERKSHKAHLSHSFFLTWIFNLCRVYDKLLLIDEKYPFALCSLLSLYIHARIHFKSSSKQFILTTMLHEEILKFNQKRSFSFNKAVESYKETFLMNFLW